MTTTSEVREALGSPGGTFHVNKENPPIYGIINKLRKQGLRIETTKTPEGVQYKRLGDAPARRKKRTTAKRAVKEKFVYPPLGSHVQVTTLSVKPNGQIVVGLDHQWIAVLVSEKDL